MNEGWLTYNRGMACIQLRYAYIHEETRPRWIIIIIQNNGKKQVICRPYIFTHIYLCLATATTTWSGWQILIFVYLETRHWCLNRRLISDNSDYLLIRMWSDYQKRNVSTPPPLEIHSGISSPSHSFTCGNSRLIRNDVTSTSAIISYVNYYGSTITSNVI